MVLVSKGFISENIDLAIIIVLPWTLLMNSKAYETKQIVTPQEILVEEARFTEYHPALILRFIQ